MRRRAACMDRLWLARLAAVTAMTLAALTMLMAGDAWAQAAQPPGQTQTEEAPAEPRKARPAARMAPTAAPATPATPPPAAPPATTQAPPAAPTPAAPAPAASQAAPAQPPPPAGAPAPSDGNASPAPATPVDAALPVAPPPPSPPLTLPPAPQQAQVAPSLPPKPDDPRAAKVYTIFDSYCARCHQTGKLEKPVPAAGFANILAVSEVAKDPARVLPGVPDASRLYEVFSQGHAPLSIYTGEGPSADDIGAVREWIRDLPGRQQQCVGREPITAAAVDGWIEEALRAEREGARELRFVSLVNLYNACVSSEEIAAARQGLAKLVNSLSWAAAAHPLRSVDPNGTLLSFRLDDFNWVAGHWQTLQAAYPKALIVPLSDKTRALAGAPNPVVRGDWLAYAATDPKLYYQLLGIPAKLSDLAKMNGADIETNVRLGRARRALVRTSDVTRGNRMAERHPGARGGFWMMYDFASSVGDQDLFERPLGPKVSALARSPFKPDSIRVLFSLPNGFPAYGLYDPAGGRIDRVLPGVDKPIYPGELHPERAGVGCFSCHASGVKAVRDEYRARAMSIDPAAPGRELRDAALALAATDGEMLLLSNADNERYHNALVAAGIDPSLTLAGEEIVTSLARRYEAGTDFDGAAVEIGLDRATFDAALSKATGTTAAIARRLQQSIRPREEIDELFAYLKGVATPVSTPPAKAPVQTTPASGDAIRLDLWIDKAKPALGEVIAINVESNNDCYLTVINVDAGGKATVLFPNDFEPDNLLSAGKVMRLPGSEAPYQLRRKEKGRELIVAQCSTSPAPPTGVEHEFSRQRFTVLGNWENFVEDAIVTEVDLRKSPEKAQRARDARAASMRRNVGTRGTAGNERADTAPGRSLSDGRAVLVIE